MNYQTIKSTQVHWSKRDRLYSIILNHCKKEEIDLPRVNNNDAMHLWWLPMRDKYSFPWIEDKQIGVYGITITNPNDSYIFKIKTRREGLLINNQQVIPVCIYKDKLTKEVNWLVTHLCEDIIPIDI